MIGAGPNGLSALKVLRECGHEAIAFEQEPSIGGLWHYQGDGTNGDQRYRGYVSLPDSDQRINPCYFSLAMNTSKIMSQFSDFPAPDSFSTFMSHSEYLQYLCEYARHFGLEEHIRLNCNVTRLVPSAQGGHGWELQYKQCENAATPATKMEVFDKVVIASGPFPIATLPHPKYPGMDAFEGIVIHSAQLRRDGDLFTGKRVLVVGGSFSAAEMVGNAVAANVKKLYWSVSSNPQEKSRWMFDRFPASSDENTSLARGWDEHITRKDYFKNPEKFNSKFVSWLQPITQREDKAGLECPPDRLTITNTAAIQRGILSGRVRKVAPINSFSRQSALLTDHTTIDKIDVVLLCTGFEAKFSFLDDLWDRKHQKETVLYRHTLPLEKQLQGLAFVGMPYTLTALFPTAELQSRWLTELWASRDYKPDGTLYTEGEMEVFRTDVQKRLRSLHPCEQYNFITDSYGFSEVLAKDVGCQPPEIDESLLSTDRELALALLVGPLIAAQYRIAGPRSWAGARDYVIKTAKGAVGEKMWQELLGKKIPIV